MQRPIQLWGGCNIWLSYQEDGNYSQIGTVKATARIGVTTADLPLVGGSVTGQTIDQTEDSAVDRRKAQAAASLSGTQADAAALNNRCYVGRRDHSLRDGRRRPGAYEYNLCYLVRGVYGTEDEIIDHPAGSKICADRRRVLLRPWPIRAESTNTVYLKFQSFNVYGGGTQSLADCTDSPTRSPAPALASPLPDVTDLYTNYEAGFQKIFHWDEIEDFRNGILYEIRQGEDFRDAVQFIRSQAGPPFIAQGNGNSSSRRAASRSPG